MPVHHGPDGLLASPVLSALGFTARWAALLADVGPVAQPARVVRDDRGSVVAAGDGWQRRLDLGRDLTAVTGDWLAVDGDRILAVLDRTTAINRPRPDGPAQTLAANMDLVGVVHGLDVPLNRRRLERGLVLAWESGAMPVILLTKADVAADLDAALDAARASAPGVDVLVVSTVDGRGLDDLAALLQPNRTLALIGASGAGKSSLVNGLLGSEVLATGDVRHGDRKGRHTTTHRELVTLPGGGVLLDTPGLRALALGAVDEGIDLAFPDIEGLAEQCRFSDCRHDNEPGCAVLAAVADGTISTDRYEGWRRIRREAANAALRADRAAFRQRSREWGRMGREAMRVKQGGDGRGRD